ncbi:MAG: CPBP family intramembrane metalloprotease [Acidobacteria bacterium]|nr:CPBP family intramembrane metalloprotease [Acidobacteriota bacterium]
MTDFFYNDAGRLRSVWRLAAFVAAYFAVSTFVFRSVDLAGLLLLPRPVYHRLFDGMAWFAIQSVLIFVPAALIGWGCAWLLEELPWRSLGWALHRGWVRDLVLGTAGGGVAVGAAALVGAAAGSYRFSFEGLKAGVLLTLVVSFVVFMLGAAAEEMLFRGYPLQTLMRSWPLWVALLPVSAPFALAHLLNPNVAPGFTFLNTALAGVWLGVAYWRTRSLWFALGLHFGWNWVQGALLGSPVSGIKGITPHPLLNFADAGPAWLGGGAYGIEGGAVCTLALVLATLYTWRTRLVSATSELKSYTDGENPNPQAPRITPSRE